MFSLKMPLSFFGSKASKRENNENFSAQSKKHNIYVIILMHLISLIKHSSAYRNACSNFL